MLDILKFNMKGRGQFCTSTGQSGLSVDINDFLIYARFSHESVGEGDDRHLILERCPETSMYVKTPKTITFCSLSSFSFYYFIDVILYPSRFFHKEKTSEKI